jgi:hypothetical protein
MANLDSPKKESLKAALRACSAPWVAFALNSETANRDERMNGMAGLIDWHLHGQVSSLLAGNRIGKNEFCLIPGTTAGSTSFLLYQHGEKPSVSELTDRVQQLKIGEICLAESTFPEDFLPELKQNLKKEGIRCTKLEPDFS